MKLESHHIKYEDSAMGKLQRSLDSQHTERIDELQKLRDDFEKYRAEQASYQAAQEHRAKKAERKGFWLGIISNGIAAVIGGLVVYYWPHVIAFFLKLFH